MRRVIAAAAALVWVCLVSCGFPVSPAGGDGGLDPDGSPPPVVTVGFVESSSLEDESSGTVMIPVRLSEPASDTVSVAFEVAGSSSATSPEDFALVSATPLTFSPGEVLQHIELSIVADEIVEPHETIVLELHSPMGATLGTSTHTLTIHANMLPRVTVKMSKSSDTENNGGKVIFELDVASSTDVSVEFNVGGTATTADHNLAPGTVTFAAGSKKEELSFRVEDDMLDEDDETIVVTLHNPVGAMPGSPAEATYTILDNDPEPKVRFTTDHMTVAEGAITVTFDVSLERVSGRTVTVPYTVDPGSTATLNVDYEISPASPLTFPAGTQVQSISIMILQDMEPEPAETVKLDLGSPMNATLGAAASTTRTLTISNDDPWCGGTGTFELCYNEMPPSQTTLPSTIDTTTYNQCRSATSAWKDTSVTQPDVCVITATHINITNPVRVTGTRPLVLFASGDITIGPNGVLDVSSTKAGSVGPASPSALCGTPSAPGTGGGGAGGSFLTGGGDGGFGSDGAFGGEAPSQTLPPNVLRAGCDGQQGDGGGTPGRGGGVVYLIARGTLTIDGGAVNASGSAGRAGGAKSGGSGGGSGGVILLHASSLDVTGARLLANGGGGASGGIPGQGGVDGTDPDVTMPLMAAPGGPGAGRAGGNGYASGLAAGNGNGTGLQNEGGGGGGGGGGLLQSNQPLTGAQASAGRVIITQ